MQRGWFVHRIALRLIQSNLWLGVHHWLCVLANHLKAHKIRFSKMHPQSAQHLETYYKHMNILNSHTFQVFVLQVLEGSPMVGNGCGSSTICMLRICLPSACDVVPIACIWETFDLQMNVTKYAPKRSMRYDVWFPHTE